MGDQQCLGTLKDPTGQIGLVALSSALRPGSTSNPVGSHTFFEPAELGSALFGAGQEDAAVGRCTVYKLQLSCIGVRLLSLSPPVTCCPRTAEATRNGIETTALGIASGPGIAQGWVCLCSTLAAWPRGIACRPSCPGT